MTDHGYWVWNDGGRRAAGFKGRAGDCVTRAIAIATGKPYREVYDALFEAMTPTASLGRSRRRPSPRNGIYSFIWKPYLLSLGFKWVSKPGYFTKSNLPHKGVVIVYTHRHLAAVIDGVIHDVWDSSKGGDKEMTGYFVKT